MKPEELYEIEEIAPDTYRIAEGGFMNAYLLLGSRILLDRKKNAFPGIVRSGRDEEQKTAIIYNTGHIYSR